MPRTRGWEDYIPAHGEAEVGLKLKGGYGKKPRGGRMMRRNYRRRNSTRNAVFNVSPAAWANNNWAYERPNLIESMAAPVSTVGVRLLSWNADSCAADPDETVQLKRIVCEGVLTAGLGRARADVGGIVNMNAAYRDDIPGFAGGQGTGGYYGALLSGDYDTASQFAPVSQWEGEPCWLGLIYETYQQANQAFDTVYPDGVFENFVRQRNKGMFWSRMYCPALFKPAMVRLNKTFPGRGMTLRRTQREIYQVSLIYWSALKNSGAQDTAMGFTCGTARGYWQEEQR